MRFCVMRVAPAVFVVAILSWSWRSDFQASEAAEQKALLFDHTASAFEQSKVDASVSSIDTRTTVSRWARRDAGQVRVPVEARTSLIDLFTFTSTARATDPPTSVEGSGMPTKCSVNTDAKDANNCSVGKTKIEETAKCSVNTKSSGDKGGGNGFGAGCSTTTSGTTVCSAFADSKPPVPKGSDNTPCSAAGDFSKKPPVSSSCSAGTTGATSCSTGGGQTIPGSSDGAVVCSALGSGVDGNSCSATGDTTDVQCSTFAGQHQACSAGYTKGTNKASCSAKGAPGKDKTALCSVLGGGPPDPDNQHDNKCSAIAYGADPGTSAHCSTAVGAGAGALCSVVADAAGKTPNAACSAVPFPGTPLPKGYTCSVEMPGGTAGTCSVISPGPPPKVTGGPDPKTGLCGGPIHGHDDPPKKP